MKLVEKWPLIEAKSEPGADLTIKGALRLVREGKTSSGNAEWYTPPCYVEAARTVMGSIDCDPATCDIAQETVRASVYHTVHDDGLSHTWTGNVFHNPLYRMPDVSDFTGKLCAELSTGNVNQAFS